jgi:hypothetical protein
MGMNLGSGFAVGGGADALQELWQLLAQQEDMSQRRKLDGERLKLDARRVEQDGELRRIALEDRADARADMQQKNAQAGAKMIAGQLRPRSLVTPDQSAALAAGGLGDKLVAPTLDSRNIGQGMASTPNPGRGESFAGLPDQLDEDAQDAERERQMTLQPKLRGRLQMVGMLPRANRAGVMTEIMREEAKPAPKSAALQEYEDAKANGFTGSFMQYQTEDANRRRPVTNINTGAKAAEADAAKVREQNEVQDSIALIQQIRNDPALSASTGPVEGRGAGFLTAGPEGYTRVKALHDNLVNKLQLAQAGKLKGQGQISNMEREMLSKAATALQMKLGDADYLNELAKVETQFQRMLSSAATAPGATVNLIWDGSKFVKPGGGQ